MSTLRTRGTVATAGFVALDVILHRDDVGHAAGGTAGNVAANLAFLGWTAAAVGDLGNDPAGHQVIASLKRAGVSVTNMRLRTKVATPVVIHEISTEGHRFRFGCPQCGRRFAYHHPLSITAAKDYLSAATPDVFFFDRATRGALWLAAELKAAHKLIVFEPAGLGDLAQFQRALEVADIVKFSEERGRRFAEFVPPATRQIQIKTLGERGAVWRVGADGWVMAEAVPARAVSDAGGAGDWMTAGLLSSLDSLSPEKLGEANWAAILRDSQALASLSCGVLGARGLSEALTAKAVRTQVESSRASRTPELGGGHQTLVRADPTSSCLACLG